MTKKILVSGAAGFIGFHLVKALKKRGDHVIAVDNFNDYYSQELKKDRSFLLEQLGVKVIDLDLCNLKGLEHLIQNDPPSCVVHLAAQAGVRYSLKNPHAYIASNITAFVNLLEVLKKSPHTPLIYASSSSVYGLNEKSPFSVDDKSDLPASLYGATKKSNELIAHAYHHIYNIPMTGLRFFTVYGPWGRPDMAYYSFSKDIIEGNPIKVFNHGNMQRDFTYIDDIILGILGAIDHNHNGFKVYNLGNHQPETLINFIEVLENSLGKKAIKDFLPMQSGDVVSTYADIDVSKELGFFPSVSLKEGIEHFVKWFKDYHKIS